MDGKSGQTHSAGPGKTKGLALTSPPLGDLKRFDNPPSVLSEPHLSQQLGDKTLSEWITQSPQRGTLRKLPGDAFVWRIDASNVDSVRAELVKSGLLIAYPQASP